MRGRLPVRGVCIRSISAATLVVVGWVAMEALLMKTVAISRPPEATKRKSKSRNESMILSTMTAVGGNLTAGSPRRGGDVLNERGLVSPVVEYEKTTPASMTEKE